MKIYIRGGIGDFLQNLPFVLMQPTQEYYIHTHFSGAKEFFHEFGIKNPVIYQFKNPQEHDLQIDQIMKSLSEEEKNSFTECPRYFYTKLSFRDDLKNEAQKLVDSFPVKRKVIGIHPFGGEFAANVYRELGLPQKLVPKEIVEEITSDNFNYLIFGTKTELFESGILESDNVKGVSFDNVLGALACVQFCDLFLGTDSCFKTMSAMHNIPTAIIVGDFEDEMRDSMFINQYVTDNVMKVYKFKDASAEKEDIVKFFNEQKVTL